MSQQVQFVYLTQAEYDSLSPKVESRLYFTSDTNKIYRGSTLYSSRLVEDLTNWGETNINFNELQAKTLQVEDPETKEMKNVSLEGHIHDEYLTSVSWDDVQGKPDIPTSTLDLTNDSNFITLIDVMDAMKDEVEFGSIEADEIWLDGKQLTWDDILSTIDPSKIKAEELDWSTVEGMSFNTLTANSIKVNNTAVSLEGHKHTVSDITNLDLTKYALATHTHTKSEISDFAHTHTKAQITDFAHTHTKSQITDFSHTHNISDITNLQSELEGKSDDGHTHSVEDITDWDTTDIKFNSIDATSLTVNGNEVSVEGHTHTQYVTMQQVKDEMQDEVQFGSIEADELWLDGTRITAADITKGGAEFQLKIPSQLVDKTIDKLVVNKLTSSEYNALKSSGTLNDEELYFIESNDVDILDAKGNAVVNVGNPVNLTDAATKGYVDTQVSNARQDVAGMETRIEDNVKEYIDEVVEDTPGKIYLTDEGVGLDDTLSDAHVVKCTHEKYQWYLNNYTREELAKYVFVLESDVEDMLGKRVTRVGAPEEDTDAATKKYVDDSLSAFTPSSGGKATDDYIQLVKPEFDDSKVYLSISFYEDFNMESPALTIDSGDATQLQYFRAYLNSGNSRKWIVPSEQGLGSEHDYAPVCVLVKKYMEDNASEFDLVCASFYWYWKDESDIQHKSDVCSSIFPATSELSGGLPFGFQVIEMRGTTAAGKNVKYKVLAKDVVEI